MLLKDVLRDPDPDEEGASGGRGGGGDAGDGGEAAGDEAGASGGSGGGGAETAQRRGPASNGRALYPLPRGPGVLDTRWRDARPSRRTSVQPGTLFTAGHH